MDDGGLAKALQLSPEAAARARKQWAGRGALYVRNAMVEEIRTRQRGGDGFLRKSVAFAIGAAGFTVYPTANYALFVDQPTRPHIIRPRRRQALAFARAGGQATRSLGGEVGTRFAFGGRQATAGAVIVKSVRHPGSRGLGFEAATSRAIQEPLRRDLEDILKSARQYAGIR